jgi:hypothetical protein
MPNQIISEPLWKFGYQPLIFGLRPCSDSAGSHVSQRAERKGKFGDVVPIGRIDDKEEIVVAGRSDRPV